MKCPECGNLFKPKNSKQKYCFRDCTWHAKQRKDLLKMSPDEYANRMAKKLEMLEDNILPQEWRWIIYVKFIWRDL